MSQPFQVICINDKNIPKDIPVEYHVKEGEMYTVKDIQLLHTQTVHGFVLQEKPLPKEHCFPYEYWGAHRFREVKEEELYALDNAIEELLCTTT